jgi:HTH-type transcriptional regulator/antitoxin HipB
MIKNNKQASIAKETLKELEHNLSEFKLKEAEMSHAEFELGNNSFQELIRDLKNEIGEYEALVQGNFHCFQPKKLSDINKILISARIAKKMSQRELAGIIGIQEQQIQRYEATDYESATWTRIQEVALALNINFYFEKILLLPTMPDFQRPSDNSAHYIEEAKSKVKEKGLLCIE